MADVGSKREAELRKKEICRFCLAQHSKLAPIYIENSRIKSTAPLPLQIMAITSIEVQRNDEMPKFICLDCRLLFEHCYRFKQMCKNADTLLRQYPLTGKWPDALTKPRAPILDNQVQPKKLLNSLANTVQVQSVEVLETNFLTKKLLNTAAVSTPEPPVPPRASPQKLKQSSMTSYQVKVENNEELSMDDVQNMLADISEELHETDMPSVSLMSSPDKPKVLNKSSVRLLNKGSTTSLEPRLSKPQLKHCKDGNVTLVTEILQPDATDSPTDPIKNTAPVPTNVFSCSDCDRSFPLKQLLDIHSMNHTRTRSFQCQQCEKAFFSKYDLQKHTIIHTGERPYKCSVCEKTFTRRALLHRHERTHTDVPKFICLVCERPFISREEMEKHAERHAKKRPFKCGICQKAFAFKQGLERHEVIHSTNLPFPCQYCNRSFVTAGKLARHLVAHAGKRVYPCKYCPKSYLLSHHLSRHVRMHKQASSFFCSVCKDAYQTYESLVDHSTVHANATLICPLCNANIGEAANVAAHIQEHKESERHACEFCDFIFLSSSFLQKHIEDDHVVDMVPYQNDEENENEEEGIKEEEMEEEFLAELLTEAEVATPSPSPPQAKAQARKSDTKIDKTKRDSRSRTIKQETVSPDNLKRSRISQKSPAATSVSPEGKRQTRHQGKEKTVTPTDTGKRGLKRIVVEQKNTKQRNGRSSK